VDRYVRAQEAPPPLTAVVQAALRQYLGDRGYLGEARLLRIRPAGRGSFAEACEEVVAAIRISTSLEPTERPAKSTASIIEKLRRETIRLSQMQDIAGCRLVVEDIKTQDQVVERLKSTFAKVVAVDRRKQPSYGYRAVHLIPTARNRPIEIQVRTEFQHLWAQLSEAWSDAIDPAIKYGGGEPDTQALLSEISESIVKVEDLELAPGSAELAQKLAQTKQRFREQLKKTIAMGLDLLEG
jgi:ppGpp synthetase/RelA/SpoT-type nucleotidyltranferase